MERRDHWGYCQTTGGLMLIMKYDVTTPIGFYHRDDVRIFVV